MKNVFLFAKNLNFCHLAHSRWKVLQVLPQIFVTTDVFYWHYRVTRLCFDCPFIRHEIGDFENISTTYASLTELTVVLLTNNNLAPNSLQVCSRSWSSDTQVILSSNSKRKDESNNRRLCHKATCGGHSQCIESHGCQRTKEINFQGDENRGEKAKPLFFRKVIEW